MFFIPFHGQFWLSTFCHQSKNIYRLSVLYFTPLELITPSHVCKIFRSLGKPVRNWHPPSVILFVLENFFSDCLGAGCLLNFARRTALGARRTDFLLLGSLQLGRNLIEKLPHILRRKWTKNYCIFYCVIWKKSYRIFQGVIWDKTLLHLSRCNLTKSITVSAKFESTDPPPLPTKILKNKGGAVIVNSLPFFL